MRNRVKYYKEIARKTLPVVKNINYRDIIGENITIDGDISGIESNPFTGICISNVTIELTKKKLDYFLAKKTKLGAQTPMMPKKDDEAADWKMGRHGAALGGKSRNIVAIREMIAEVGEDELLQILSKENSTGETALYIAAEYAYFELVRELIQFYDLAAAGVKARDGLDALHIAAKQGDLEVVNYFLESESSLATIARSNGKTSIHSAARNGHAQVVKALLSKELK